MKRLHQEKLLTLISTAALEDILTAIIYRSGASGYTVIQASGAGSTGIQSGRLDIDTNILVYVILPEARVPLLLDELERLMRQGYPLKCFVSDIGVFSLVPHPPGLTRP